MKSKLIEVKDLKKYYPAKKSSIIGKTQYLKAVDGVSFYINEGETLVWWGNLAVENQLLVRVL